MHCWVNKGAKGIALIDDENRKKLRYVFDISDVHKARRIGHFPHLWEMGEEHEEEVLSHLEKTYGNTDKEAGFAGRIQEIADRIAEDCYKEIVEGMKYLKEGSFLEELDELNMEILSQIGTNISELSKPIFTEIGKVIEEYEKEADKNLNQKGHAIYLKYAIML